MLLYRSSLTNVDRTIRQSGKLSDAWNYEHVKYSNLATPIIRLCASPWFHAIRKMEYGVVLTFTRLQN
jgi:hypothetical protein